MKINLYFLLSFAVLGGQTAADNHLPEYDVVETTPSNFGEEYAVTYTCEFTSLWTSDRHPELYPINDAKWKEPMMVTHTSDFRLWSPDNIASAGLERYSETGKCNVLVLEILESGMKPSDIEIGRDMGANAMGGSQYQRQTFRDLTVTPNTPYISTAASMQPATDWFTGFYAFNLMDPTTMTWYDSFTIETNPWDAGTETGDSYVLGNSAEMTQLPVSLLDINSLSTGVLRSPESTVLPVASWRCKMLSSYLFDVANGDEDGFEDGEDVTVVSAGINDNANVNDSGAGAVEGDGAGADADAVVGAGTDADVDADAGVDADADADAAGGVVGSGAGTGASVGDDAGDVLVTDNGAQVEAGSGSNGGNVLTANAVEGAFEISGADIKTTLHFLQCIGIMSLSFFLLLG